MIALRLCYKKNVKGTSDGKAEWTRCPHHTPTTRMDPLLLSTSTSSAHSQLLIGKLWGIHYHPPVHTHPCSRLHLIDELVPIANSCIPTLISDSPSTAQRVLHSSHIQVHSVRQSSNIQVQCSSCSSPFQKKLSRERKTAVSQEDSQVCLPLKGGGYIQ